MRSPVPRTRGSRRPTGDPTTRLGSSVLFPIAAWDPSWTRLDANGWDCMDGWQKRPTPGGRSGRAGNCRRLRPHCRLRMSPRILAALPFLLLCAGCGTARNWQEVPVKSLNFADVYQGIEEIAKDGFVPDPDGCD